MFCQHVCFIITKDELKEDTMTYQMGPVGIPGTNIQPPKKAPGKPAPKPAPKSDTDSKPVPSGRKERKPTTTTPKKKLSKLSLQQV